MNVFMILISLVLAVLVVIAACIVVRRNWYAQAFLLLAGCLAVICAILALHHWFHTDSVDAAVLTAVAVGVSALLAAAVVDRMMRIKHRG